MNLTARQFWELMERWKVSDAVALELIGFAGKTGKLGKRPRFRFLPAHQQAADFMGEIDAALATIGEDPADWLHKKNQSLGRRIPIDLMRAEGMTGMEKVLLTLHRAALRTSLHSPKDRT
jgi:antitoxin Xre/MbcA/ParS-like protein